MSAKLDAAKYNEWTQEQWLAYIGQHHNEIEPDFYDTMGKVALFGSKEFVDKMDTVAVSYPGIHFDDPDGSLKNAALEQHNKTFKMLLTSGKSFIRSIITERGVFPDSIRVTHETIYVRTHDNKPILLTRKANNDRYKCKDAYDKKCDAVSQQWQKIECEGDKISLTPICDDPKLVKELAKQISDVKAVKAEAALDQLIIPDYF